jgi:hypothetical protein
MSYNIEVTGYVTCTIHRLTAEERAARGDNAVAILSVAGRDKRETHRIIPLTGEDVATIRRAMAQVSEPVTS